MKEQTTNAMTTQENERFLLPDMVGGEFAKDDLAEDMDGLSVSFQRVKIPGGGVLQFEVPGDDPENPDYEKNLTGVILFNHATNAYWPEGAEPSDDNPPLCQSANGKTGYGEPGGLCSSCKLNQFGSAEKGRGKACKNMRTLYLLRSGDVMPIMLILPPTSIKPFRQFINSVFTLRKRATYGSLVQIGLKKEESGGFTYSVATFRKLRDFEGEELQRVCAYAASFREQAKAVIEERAEQNRASAESNVELAAELPVLPDNDTHFSIIPGNAGVGASVIDGEREALPA